MILQHIVPETQRTVEGLAVLSRIQQAKYARTCIYPSVHSPFVPRTPDPFITL